MTIRSLRAKDMTKAVVVAIALVMAACTTTPYVQSQDLAAKVLNARTSADHEELAVIYEREAKEALDLSKLHRQNGRLYASYPGKGYGSAMANHCEALATKYSEIAAEKSAMVKAHRELATKTQ